MFPLAGDADVLVFACWSSATAAVEVSTYGGIASSTAKLFRWFVAVSKGQFRAVGVSSVPSQGRVGCS